MPKDTKTLGNSKARACESLGFVHKKRLCQSFDTFTRNSTVERINVRMEKANRWKGKSIGMPKNGVSYCI